MKNNPKLESFLSKLTDPALPVEQQSFLLRTSDSEMEGGDNEECVNRGSLACAGTNEGCTNYSCPSRSKNYGCTNGDDLPIGGTNSVGCNTPIGGGKGELPIT